MNTFNTGLLVEAHQRWKEIDEENSDFTKDKET